MIVAVFGDVHGNLPGLYDCVKRWEEKSGGKIDLVLQTGDMGLFRSEEEMDKASRKHLARDATELAAAVYLSGERGASVETWFAHGNHENFSLLKERENRAVDPAGRIVFLGPCAIREFRRDGESLRVAALGGMEYRFGKFPIPTDERISKYLHPPSLEKLQKEKPQADVLLLHEAPFNKGLRDQFPTGSKRITDLIEALRPRFAFYGHYGDPPEPFLIGPTLCACMNNVRAWRIQGRDGAMGIVRTQGWEFEFVKG